MPSMTIILVFMLLAQKGMATTVTVNKENNMHRKSVVTEVLSINPAGELVEAPHHKNGLDVKRLENNDLRQEQSQVKQEQGQADQQRSMRRQREVRQLGINPTGDVMQESIVDQRIGVKQALFIDPAGDMTEASHPKNGLDTERAENKDRQQEQRQADEERFMQQEKGVRNVVTNSSEEVTETSDLLVEHAKRHSDLRSTPSQLETKGFWTNASLLEANATRVEGSFRSLLNKRNEVERQVMENDDEKCTVVVYQHGDFNGKSVTYGVGSDRYMKPDNDASSLKVVGPYCWAQLWEHYDENKGKSGATAKFKVGNYVSGAFKDVGNKNNWHKIQDKASSIKVTLVNEPRRRRDRRRARALCATITDDTCGEAKLKDASQVQQKCAADPCTSTDQICCKSTAKCSTITDIVCGAGKIKDVVQDEKYCASDKCSEEDQKCCIAADSEDYYVSDSNEACPNPIVTSDECETAATELGGEWVGEEEWSDRCFGCLVDFGSKAVFNTDQAGQCENDDQTPVCKTQCSEIKNDTKCTADAACQWLGVVCSEPVIKAGTFRSPLSIGFVLLPCYIAWA